MADNVMLSIGMITGFELQGIFTSTDVDHFIGAFTSDVPGLVQIPPPAESMNDDYDYERDRKMEVFINRDNVIYIRVNDVKAGEKAEA